MFGIPRLYLGLGIAALVLIVLAVVYLNGKSSGRAEIETKIERANTEAVATDAKAREAAAEARVADAEAVMELKEELVDAVENTPDEKPDAVRIALGCERLRRAGRDTALIPACAGHQRGN